MRSRIGLAGAVAGIAGICPLSGADTTGTDYFESYVRPVLANQCYACHSAEIPVPQGGLRVDSLEALLTGGNRGPALIPGDPEASLLMAALRHSGEVNMPPAGKLDDAVLEYIETWIRNGAPYPDAAGAEIPADAPHWSFEPSDSPDVPTVTGDWARTDIDRFILARLESADLEPSDQADPRTLMRRVHYDLTGLPPDPDVIDAFARSPTDDAYLAIVDSLLASELFGQRWARHWLDVARYADSGYFGRPFPIAWTYRDWVASAFNEDLPFDDFVLYQLAADLAGAPKRHLPAMGLLTLGTNLPRPTDVPENLDDRIDVVTRGLLGLSVSCARCHDHKFDRISQKDYYSLYSVFLNSPDVLEPVPLESPGPDTNSEFFLEKLDLRRKWLDRFREERLADHVSDLRQPETLARYLEVAWSARDATNREAETLSKERDLNLYMLNRWRSYLRGLVGPSIEAFRDLDSEGGAERVARRIVEADSVYRWPDPQREALRLALRGTGSPTDVPIEDFWWVQNEGDSNVVKALKWQYEAVMHEWGHRGGPRHATVVNDAGKPQPTYVFVRGNQHDKGAEVAPRFLAALPGPSVFESGSGRLELARIIASAENPLLARVMVNRIWGHLFGEGIVRTPSDFGVRGDRPTHPELLDFLATEFVEDGWSVKGAIRRLVLSNAYRQSSSRSEIGTAKDPGNRLLWRQNRSRLDFESLRDSMLAVAGELDTSIGGPPFDLVARPASTRRALYAFVSREHPSQLMRAFDFSNPEEHSPRRQLTTVPQQALFLMNSPFMAGRARAVAAECGDPERCIERIHRRVLGRLPDAREFGEAKAFLLQVRQLNGGSADDAVEPATWDQGTANLDPTTGEVSGFRRMAYRVEDRLQPMSLLPAPEFGRASLTPTGGFPGDTVEHAVVRRWRAPRTMKISVNGTLSHRMGSQARRFDYSNGVRGWIASSGKGLLASWIAKGIEAETVIRNIEVEEGEHVDFVVDSLGDYESDAFSWAPQIEEVLPVDQQAAGMVPRIWSADEGFREPAMPPLGPLEQYAQVLLMTNEFAFRD